MRLPFPERVPLFKVFIFLVVLCSLQQLEGTSAIFSLCTFCFVMISAYAFNLAGGLTMPSGGFVFAFTLLVALFGIVVKVFINEPGNSNLRQPDLTMEVYVATAVAMLAAVFVSRRLQSKASLLPQFKNDDDMYRSAVGCLFVGGTLQVFNTFDPSEVVAGSLRAALQQLLGGFLAFSIVLGVMYEVRVSGGRKSMNVPTAIAMVLVFIGGIIGYSKQGMFIPLVAWLFPAAAGRLKMSLIQIAGIALALGFVVQYLVPYSQIGRSFRIEGAPFRVNFAINVYLLGHLEEIRKLSKEPMGMNPDDEIFAYYNQSEGLADRLQMITPDDALINTTEMTSEFGISPTIFDFENVIPHFLWPAKPNLSFGNIYAHEVGILTDEEDVSTGISFSPAGDAYHQARWLGVGLMLPILLAMFFTLSDSVGGDTRKSPFALGLLIGSLHGAPEGMIGGLVTGSTLGMLANFFAAFVATRIMPLIANLVIGPPRKRFEGNRMTAPQPGPFSPPPGEIQQAESTAG